MVQEIVTKVLTDNRNRRVTIIEPDAPAATKTAQAKGKKATASQANGKKTEAGQAAGKKLDANQAVEKKKNEADQTAEKVSEAKGNEAEKAISAEKAFEPVEGTPCPLCGKGSIIKGRTAYGCSEWRNGCTWRHPF